MRSAVIGAGVVGKLHARILSDMGQLCAVCDIDDRVLEKYPDYPVYKDYREMIEKEKPDSVHICTPHYLHVQMAIYALEKNINVLCEKPLCISREEIKAIAEAEKKSGATFGVCLQNRYNPENRYAEEYLKGKKIVCATGTVFWRRTAEYYASAAWRGTLRQEGGGVLINQAYHTLDLLIHFAGRPEKIVSDVCDRKLGDCIEVEDTAVIQSTSGAPVTLFATNCASSDMPVYISVRTEDETIHILPSTVIINGEPVRPEGSSEVGFGKECYGAGHKALIEDFYRCVNSGEKFPIGAKEGAAALEVILAAYKSNRTETEVIYE